MNKKATSDVGAFMAFLAMIFVVAPAPGQSKIEFYVEPTITLEGMSLEPYALDFRDTLGGDTLYQVRARNGYPVSYHRKIRTSVCFDNKCRLLNIIVHWNITGRYSGFELPPGEFLSKAEHTAFNDKEYIRLHRLLADPNSPLSGFSYNEIVPAQPEASADIDAVSSPTAKNLLEFVVEGAAYTTYKLWHIVYGNTREEVSRLTAETLTPELLLLILKSPVVSDKIWGLDHRWYIKESSDEIQDLIVSFVTSAEFSLAERAVNAISVEDLADTDFQVTLLNVIDDVNYSLKNRLIEKFGEADVISAEARVLLAEKLLQVRGELVGTILKLFTGKKVNDPEVLHKVATLLQSDNFFISRQAYTFLKSLELSDEQIRKAVMDYGARHGLR